MKSFLFYARWKSTEEKQQFINELCLKYHPSFTFYTQCCFPSKMVSRVSIYALVPQSLPWGFYILKAILFEYKSLLRRIFWTISNFLFSLFFSKRAKATLHLNSISQRTWIKVLHVERQWNTQNMNYNLEKQHLRRNLRRIYIFIVIYTIWIMFWKSQSNSNYHSSYTNIFIRL